MTSLDNLIKNSKELSSLPEIYIRVSELLDDESSTSEQIGTLVQSDPALAVRILKVVNSAYYGFPNEISTISQAINILGRNPLRQLLMGTVLGGVFSRLSNDVFAIDAFWQHSVHTAVIAKYCYEHIVGKFKSDEIFIAGLLHDIGHLVIAHALPDISTHIQQARTEHKHNVCAIEHNLLGFSHNEVAAAIMQQWELPVVLRQCALHHHTPQHAGEFTVQTWIIHIADTLSKQTLSNDKETIAAYLNNIDGWQHSGLSEEQITEAYLLAADQFRLVLESLGL